MDARDALLADYDQETASTRRLLERAPQASFDWRPHERSFTLGGLATHLARLPHWGAQILDRPFYDLDATTGRRDALADLPAVLELFDRHVAEARSLIADRPAVALDERWSLKRGQHTLLTVPKGAAFRRYALHHLVHHRGQLSVYLRLLDVPLPAIYGPTADESL